MENEIIKICKKHGDLTIKDLKTGIYKGKKYKKCKKCELERSRVYREKLYSDPATHEKEKQRNKKYWEENKQEIKQRRIKNNDPEKRRNQYKKYATKYRDYCNSKQKEYRENLHDSYIRKIIQNGDKNIPLMSIPPGMIKLKRAIIMARKAIRNSIEHKLKRRIEK